MASRSFSSVKLKSIILAQPGAKSFGSNQKFALPKGATWTGRKIELSPSRPLDSGEILEQWVSPAWRPSDIPLTFHSDSGSPSSPLSAKNIMALIDVVNEESHVLQYLFDDGLCLTASELLRHPLGRTVPRLLLPLSLQIRPEVENISLAHRPMGLRPQWLIQSDQTIATVLLATERVNRGLFSDDGDEPITLLFTLSIDRTQTRECLQFEGVDVEKEDSEEKAKIGGVLWKVISTEQNEAIYRGNVRIEPATESQIEAAETYRFDDKTHKLVFHSWRDRLDGVKAFLSSNIGPEAATSSGRLEARGHSAIQALMTEIETQSKDSGDRVVVEPKSVHLTSGELHPVLNVTSDGSFRLKFFLGSKLDGRELEAHGLPQSLHYVVHLLQSGLGATTGFANIDLAHGRRGPKRERDLKLLRHVGFATLLFYEVTSFALGLPGSDGDVVETLIEVKARLYRKFAAFLAKGDSWNPAESAEPTASLENLISEGIIALLDGTIQQIIDDCAEEKQTRVFLPAGEYRIDGLSEIVMQLFHAMLSDLARETDGTCFTKVRGTWFEAFYNKRVGFHREDLVIREVVPPEEDHKRVYTPGINERFVIPTAK
ncbi:MAG: hypothetical protein RBT63_04040, partial [Bdellovibrionales bacterium]|nr:hypothetical protein [Bdellovibrionales bacterium]